MNLCETNERTHSPSPSADAEVKPTRPPSKRHAAITESSEADHQRFWRSVSKAPHPKGCWVWTGTLTDNGYGECTASGRAVKAHRMSYFIANGCLPPVLHVCHHCDNRSCVNPAHLWLGTNYDNILDRCAKGRSPKMNPKICLHGHERTPENSLKRNNGSIRCKICELIRDRKRRSFAADAKGKKP